MPLLSGEEPNRFWGTAEALFHAEVPWQPSQFRRKIRVRGLTRNIAAGQASGLSPGKGRPSAEIQGVMGLSLSKFPYFYRCAAGVSA
jgi:hypothetical protein